MRVLVLSALVITAAAVLVAQRARQGYILKPGEGEVAAGATIKASPNTGTRGGVVIVEPFPDGLSTGLHYHVNADEFFYVSKGQGMARVNGEDHPIAAGDFVFVPAGHDHKLFAKGSTMELVAFLDKPGLDNEFRTWHRTYGEAAPASLKQLNDIARQFGTVYKTLE